MESLSEVLKVKGNTIREKSIFQANQEMNFALNKQKQTLNVNLPEDKELIGKIENLLETKNNSPKNTKNASI